MAQRYLALPCRSFLTTAAKLLLILLMPGVIHVTTASAAVVVFTDEAGFLAASGPLGFEGFEQTAPGPTGSSRVLPGFILGPLDADTSVLQILDDPAFASEGVQSAGGNTIGMFLIFDTPITALGLTIVDFGNAGIADTLTLSLFGPVIDSLVVATTSDPFERLRFFGVISSEPFSGVQLRKTEAQDFFAIDAVRFGTAQSVPEPASHLLITFGLVAGYFAAVYLRHRST